MDDNFDAKALALKPEHLESGRLADTGIAATKRERRRREFVQITREQIERLAKATNIATPKVFHFLLLIDWRSPGRVIRLANGALEQQIGVDRYAKRRALSELKKLGLIKLRKRERKSPEIVVR
jgi:hypothetical protein